MQVACESLTDAINAYWKDDDWLRQGCHTIVRYLSGRNNRILFTFAHTNRVLDHQYDVEDIRKILWSLADPAIGVVAPYYEFIDATMIEPISVSDVEDARKEGNFVHPVTGDLIRDFEPYIYLSFEAQIWGEQLCNT